MRKIESLNYGIPGRPIHAFITRDLLERMAPFSLFDHFRGRMAGNQPGGWHPHSGIATFTYMLQGDLTHRDTNDRSGTIPEGGVQWLSAGKGLWHDGEFMVEQSGGMARDLQLWVQLPPDLEMGEDYFFAILEPAEIPVVGNTKILMGEYKGVSAGFKNPVDVVYLQVELQEGETWFYKPPALYQRGFIFPFNGNDINVMGVTVPLGTMGLLEDSSQPIQVDAKSGPTTFVLALAEPGRHPIVAKHGSIHTSKERMSESLNRIAELGRAIKY